MAKILNGFCFLLASAGLVMALHLIGTTLHKADVDIIVTAPAVLGTGIMGLFSLIYKFDV
jgi:hypothetical protein